MPPSLTGCGVPLQRSLVGKRRFYVHGAIRAGSAEIGRRRRQEAARGARRYTTAPAFGSLGSPSRRPVLIRSSRLMPSHMAMAAATNTEE